MLDGQKMKHLRLLQNLTQSNVGAVLGCTKNYISILENRKQFCSEEFYQRWLSSIYKLGSMSKQEQKEYIKQLKEDSQNDLKKNK
ncbi:helix-turn-helix transcriptional regulator [Clostridium pasteurianum]|uniref:helix-turn-helix domain-containing protein n=1 Tax=Clostridium pasteurianum TaxID=1501 RepID=UPI002260E2BA|nr:helix-turn-helix transcriptional regulator [Clostridium pasteurianum]UZW14333.1 helix-turn-helix transcriptional regulator [Clostridium pasteurianum]